MSDQGWSTGRGRGPGFDPPVPLQYPARYRGTRGRVRRSNVNPAGTRFLPRGGLDGGAVGGPYGGDRRGRRSKIGTVDQAEKAVRRTARGRSNSIETAGQAERQRLTPLTKFRGILYQSAVFASLFLYILIHDDASFRGDTNTVFPSLRSGTNKCPEDQRSSVAKCGGWYQCHRTMSLVADSPESRELEETDREIPTTQLDSGQNFRGQGDPNLLPDLDPCLAYLSG
jgi:hypothetical protein